MAAPQEIGPYRVVRPLGQGGMGTVYLARDTRLNRQVALKLVAGDRSRSDAARDELLNEARAAASLNHPHIASVHDVLDVDGQVAIVFEYVEGETLEARLRRGPLTPQETVDLGIQLADALADAHQHGVIHRDLKPGNVAITRSGVVKVLDFGIARVAPDSVTDASGARTTSAGFFGTMGYAAPEQCLGQSIDARADIYALGVVLYEAVTGRRPFAGADAPTIVRAMLRDEMPRPRSIVSTVPVALDDLIVQLLSSEPSRRPATAREVRATLKTLHGEPPSKVTDVTARRLQVTAAVALVALLTGVLVTSLSRRAPASPADRPPVIAVLPLTNASGDETKDHLAVGLAESLISRLAGVPSVTVLSRAAVADARRRTNDIPALARELDVAYFVDGTVQQIADALRIDLSLIERDGTVAWADTIEGPFTSIFALQGRLASSLAQALSVRLSAADRASLARQPTASAAALDAYWRGRALLERRDRSGHIELALEAFDEAIREDPNYAEAHAARGETLWQLYGESREPADAKAAVDAGITALRLQPNSASVRYALALTLKGSGELAQAADELQRALALRPNYDDARRELGDVLARSGKVDEAIAEFNKAIELRPNYWEHHFALGTSLLRAARYEAAVEPFRRTIELQPDNASAHHNLGATLQFLGREDEALASYQRVLQIRPTAIAYANIGAIHHKQGQFAHAVEAYRASLRLRPNAAATHRNLGDALLRLNRGTEAREAYRQAVRLAETDLTVNPRDPFLLASLAVYAAKAGDSAKAQQRLQDAQGIAPDAADVLFRGAVVFALSGDTSRALDSLERAAAAGYSRTEIAQEEDLASLRKSARYQTLVRVPASGGSPR